MNAEVRFRCTGCGLCCGTPPAIRIEELFEQSVNFILGAQIRIIGGADPENGDDITIMAKTYPRLPVRRDRELRARLAAHMTEIAARHGVRTTEQVMTGSDIRFAFSLVDVDQLSGACPQRLEGGACGIYETRPTKCRLVPIDETVPEQDVGRELQAEIDFMVDHGGACEQGLDAEVLWREGRIVSEEIRSLHGRFGAKLNPMLGAVDREIINEYLNYKAMEGCTDREMIERIVLTLGVEGERPVFALVPALARCIQIGAMSNERAVVILRNQVALIDKRLPAIGPAEPISGIVGAGMRTVLTDWCEMYKIVAKSWARRDKVLASS